MIRSNPTYCSRFLWLIWPRAKPAKGHQGGLVGRRRVPCWPASAALWSTWKRRSRSKVAEARIKIGKTQFSSLHQPVWRLACSASLLCLQHFLCIHKCSISFAIVVFYVSTLYLHHFLCIWICNIFLVLLFAIADSAQTEYCTTFPLSVGPCVRHRRDISHFSHI